MLPIALEHAFINLAVRRFPDWSWGPGGRLLADASSYHPRGFCSGLLCFRLWIERSADRRCTRRCAQSFAGDAASGVIHCGIARGAGQLTVSDNVITTAAHVLFDEHGQLRGDSGHCIFSATIAGQEVTTAIDVSSVIVGDKDPYAHSAVHDWAVARLMRPVVGAAPYALGPRAQSGSAIEFVARGHSDWGSGKVMSMEDCRLHDLLSAGAEGTREFSFDCGAGIGASGGALLTPNGRLVGVFVGYRSIAPDQALPFSPQHYNFAVSVDGAFRKAVESVAATPSALSSR
jgi:hypothetical protein